MQVYLVKSWKLFSATNQTYEELTAKLITNEKLFRYFYIYICYYTLLRIFVEFVEEYTTVKHSFKVY